MPVRGEELNIDKGVGFILAMLFGFVIGLSLWAVLAGDYVQPGSVMNEHCLAIDRAKPGANRLRAFGAPDNEVADIEVG